MDDVAIVREMTALDGRVSTLERESKEMKKRQDNVDEMVQAVTALNVKLENTAEKVDTTDKKVDQISGKIEEINSKAGKRWDSVVEKVIFAVIGAVVGFLLKQVGVF